jgi:hypothetical protein
MLNGWALEPTQTLTMTNGILRGKLSLAGKTKWQKRVLCFNNENIKIEVVH